MTAQLVAEVVASDNLADWESAVEAFESSLRRRRLRYSTIKGYRSHLRSLESHAPGGPWSVTAEVAAEWLVSRGKSYNASWKAARVFYGYGQTLGLIAASPVPVIAPNISRVDSRDAIAGGFPAPWFEAVVEHSSRMRAGGRAPRTVALHLSYVRQLADEHPAGPATVTTRALRVWLGRESWAPETRRSARSIIRVFFATLEEAGLVEASPADGLDRVRVPRAHPRPAPTDAFTEALQVADDRQRLMLVLGAYTGLRAAEIARVRPSTDIQDGYLYVVGKGGHERRVPMHPVVAAEIATEMARRRAGLLGSGFRHYAEVSADGWLFPSPRGGPVAGGCVTHVLSKLLPGKWTAHTLRHRFASQAYAGCSDLRAVQELLGHSSPVTTARYTAVSDRTMQLAVDGIA